MLSNVCDLKHNYVENLKITIKNHLTLPNIKIEDELLRYY